MQLTTIEPTDNLEACVIWLHGLGASGNDMRGLVGQLHQWPSVRHVFLDAPVRPITINGRMPMRAWYDIIGAKLTDREDKEGILHSESLIHDVINQQVSNGLSLQSIYLAGFSQGAAMALYTGLKLPTIGGLIALSGYLPLSTELQATLDQNTSIWMGAGNFDEIVLPAWTHYTFEHIKTLGYTNVSLMTYPMGHEVCLQEIYDLVDWFKLKFNFEG